MKAQRERERVPVEFPRGIAIGNVTSQIFSNIYLNEFDRYVKHDLRIKKYLRYGDDFVVFTDTEDTAIQVRALMKTFLYDKLSLTLHARNDVIFSCHKGLKFLGCMIYPHRRRLQKRAWDRVLARTDRHNVSSYSGLVHAHCDAKTAKYFHWNTLEFLDG